MINLPMRVVAGYLRLTAKPTMSTVERARQRIAAVKPPSPPPVSLRRRHEVRTRQVAGFTCHTVAPGGRRAALYLHGGSYVSPMARQHWDLVARLADAGVRVEVPDYGLAPQHTFREAYALVTAVYRQLLDEVGPAAVTIAGDSAGGGLALGFAQTLAAAGLAQPRRLILIAPWLDLTLSHPDLPAAEARDPWLCSAGLREAGRAWAGGADPADPRLSPVNGPMDGLAPIHLYIGTRDLLHPDALRLPVSRLNVGEGAVHVYPLTPTRLGRAASAEIVDLIAAG
ncbi:alpha/beta hydrolase [Actinoplanes sp. NPDC024001]|uniref:alpha/beta hydrolase n=1 Tax=Actinoplanes sp. NPDC024001 TaxID=3154598 RepID=UPI00340E1FBA